MLNRIAQTLQEILYPRYCLSCQKRVVSRDTHDLICALCIDKIKPNAPPFCQKCGRTEAAHSICRSCQHTSYHFDRAWAGYVYEGTVKEMLHNFKYKNKINLGKRLSRLAIDFVKDYRLPINNCDYVISIPLSPAKLREREFNQAHILAKAIADYFGLVILENNLKRIRNTASQTELDSKGRWRNVLGAFALKEPEAVKEKTILLVDDVLTTGATACEAAKTLKNAGAGAVFVLTVAN